MRDFDIVATVTSSKSFQLFDQGRWIIQRIDYHGNGVHDTHSVNLREVKCSFRQAEI